MTEFRRIAHFSKHGESTVEVHGTDLTGRDTAYTTVWSNEDKPGIDMLGILGVRRVTPETHVVTDPSTGGHLAARAILLSAVYQGDRDVQTLATSVSRDDESKIADYKALGFVYDMGDTRSVDRKGRKLAAEAILLSKSNGRQAASELSRQNIQRSSLLPRKPVAAQDQRWRD